MTEILFNTWGIGKNLGSNNQDKRRQDCQSLIIVHSKVIYIPRMWYNIFI